MKCYMEPKCGLYERVKNENPRNVDMEKDGKTSSGDRSDEDNR